MRLALIAQVALTTALGALIASFAALYVGQQTLDQRAGLVMRTLLVTVSLLLSCWLAVRPRVLSGTRAELRLAGAVGLALGYAVSPTTWDGRTYLGQLVTGPGATTTLLDLVAWLLVGGAVVLVASAPADPHHRASYLPQAQR